MNMNETIASQEKAASTGFYNKHDIALVSGAGATLLDADGKEYIDCASGHGVAVLGHGHEAILSALSEQGRKLITCQEAYPNDQRAALQQELLEVLPGDMNRVYFCNSGTEAVEAALKMARLHSGKRGVVAAMQGFHGRTMGALSLTWNKKYREPFMPLLMDVQHVPFNNFSALEESINDETGAVMLEIVQGEGGVRPGDADYFRQVRTLCDKRGMLLIIDEVQTGFGRTGKWFACQHFNLQPDLICLGKAIGGGLPMGAVGISSIVADLPAGTHGCTFGGNPLACATSRVVIKTLKSSTLVEEAKQKGDMFKSKLAEQNLDIVKEIRGLGLMIGIELRQRVTPILKRLQELGVIALPAGPTVLRLLPPLIISEEQLFTVFERIVQALREE